MERWLAELGLEATGSAERDGVSSWDLELDGRVRARVRITLIFDAALGVVCWVHYAPPLADSLRRVYRQMLRWNDEFPFVKFSLAVDDRPVLSHEIPAPVLDADRIGLAIGRLLTICDLLYPESKAWVDRIGKAEAGAGEAGVKLLERYAAELGELA